MRDVQLRPATAKEINFIATLVAAGEESGHFLALGHTHSHRVEWLETIRSRGYTVGVDIEAHQRVVYEAALWLAEVDGMPAGFLLEVAAVGETTARGSFSPFGIPPGTAANELQMVSVTPECRGRGIAGRMVDTFLAATKDRTVFARRRPASTTMLSMLERRGFQRCGNLNEVIVLKLPPRLV